MAVLHTFLVKIFRHLAKKYKEGSVGENFFHLLGEVEVVFGIWAGFLVLFTLVTMGGAEAIAFMDKQNFTEPLFVFVIMACCSTKPILDLAEKSILWLAQLIPLPQAYRLFIVVFGIGPLLGSFITEPAAMTITAFMALKFFFQQPVSMRFRYAMIGLLFVNISIGGTLTPYAAPPVLMVAKKWNWDFAFMLEHFSIRAILASLISCFAILLYFRKELGKIEIRLTQTQKLPAWVIALHVIFVALIVLTSHHPNIFLGLFLFFLGMVTVTKEYQNPIHLRESLLVAFFLGGIVILGGPQKWWLTPVLQSLNEIPLYFISAILTSFTDNAALTYLGSQVSGLSDLAKYSLVAGSVVGGGLTVIANAPNPAGYGILNSSFGDEGINPLYLFFGALIPTLIAMVCFFP